MSDSVFSETNSMKLKKKAEMTAKKESDRPMLWQTASKQYRPVVLDYKINE